MQTYVVEKTDKSIKVGFKDVNLTMIGPLSKRSMMTRSRDRKVLDKHPEPVTGRSTSRSRGKSPRPLEQGLQEDLEYYSLSTSEHFHAVQELQPLPRPMSA